MALKSTILLAVMVVSDAVAPGWPKDAQGNPKACAAAPKVLRDSRLGWPDKCHGLLELDNKTTYTNTTCKAACAANPQCEVWQLTPEKKCWHSVPGHRAYNCYEGQGRLSNFYGQRIQHGTIKLVKNLKGFWISTGMKSIGLMGPSTAPLEAQERCRDQCYSDINCRFWQFGGATNPGCFVEAPPSHTVPDQVPLESNSDNAKMSLAGEQIDHICVPDSFILTAASKGDSTLVWVLTIGGAIITALIILAAVYFLFCRSAEPKPKKTRAVKITQKPKAEEPVAMSPMPLLAPTYTTYVAPTLHGSLRQGRQGSGCNSNFRKLVASRRKH